MTDDVFLRPLTPEDIGETYLGWFRDPQVTRFLEAREISKMTAVSDTLVLNPQVREAYLGE